MTEASITVTQIKKHLDTHGKIAKNVREKNKKRDNIIGSYKQRHRNKDKYYGCVLSLYSSQVELSADWEININNVKLENIL